MIPAIIRFSSRFALAGVAPGVWRLLAARSLRGFCDGFIAVLLPAYLLALGMSTLSVGLVSTSTLLGSAIATIVVGMIGNRYSSRSLLLIAAAMMGATGIGFFSFSTLWPLLVVAFVGTMNPSAGDVSLFLPIEHACLAEASQAQARTALFARYSLVGALSGALGALLAGVPDLIAAHFEVLALSAMRAMFMIYALSGLAILILYLYMPSRQRLATTVRTSLGPSRWIVMRLAMLFSLDAFAGGLVVNALLTLWLIARFELSIGAAGEFFFCTGLLSAGSQLAAAPLARKIGLLNTMVFTHIPSSLCLIAAAFMPSLPLALLMLLLRSALSQLDVPTRSAYVMSVVTPAERAAAASLTAVPRSLAAAIAPTIAGGLIGLGWLEAPLIACGVLKIIYDLALLTAFRHVRLDGDRS
ncbi:Major Facilitator Superfamily protein [Caballeronia catudaia]|uniref:Major Facilitator Superfamily protein n=1 Tax=Caballeronia catudaia TaxID=1777136 RepID=A0A158BLJ9_9BURK|nr:MFS transporter [Caballeronia catudaia]SAK70969.1 Major Facilitator Superfamily protein [Caballeronia catudaia]